MNVLSFGEILWDVYPDSKYIGGAPLNFAAHISKQGHNAYMMSSLGGDELGQEAIKQLKKWKISTEFVSVLENFKTGICRVTLDKNSVPSYDLLADVAYDYISSDKVVEDFDVLYFGTLALRSEYNFNSLKKIIYTSKFKEVFVDINIRTPFFSKETVEFAIENATIVKISLEEMSVTSKLLFDQSVESYKAFSEMLSKKYPNIKCIIITLGENGAYAFDCKKLAKHFCDSEKIEVKSTVGAGDSFSAAFLSKYLQGKDISDCLKYASKIAGIVVSDYSAVPDYNMEDFE